MGMLFLRRHQAGGPWGLRGQTMVEFIIILAALAVLSLLVAGFLGILPKNTLNVQIEQSKTYWSSQAAPIKIIDWSMMTLNKTSPQLAVASNLSLVLLNPTTQVITIEKVQITPGNFSQIYFADGTWAGPANALSIILHPGEQKVIVAQHWEEGPAAFVPPEIYQFALSFEYISAFSSHSVEAGVVPLVGGNRYLLGDPGTDCPNGLTSCGNGVCAPPERCCGDGACTPGRYCCGADCCQASLELCLNGTCVSAENCTAPSFKCGNSCCNETQICNATTTTCQSCASPTSVACNTTCCPDGQFCEKATSSCTASCDPPSFTCPSGSSNCCNGTQYHFCNATDGACLEFCAPESVCGPDVNGTTFCCTSTQTCNNETKQCENLACTDPGQTLCNSTDGNVSNCCSNGLGCANLTGTCCDTNTTLKPSSVLCNYTNITGSFSACCLGMDCNSSFGCCVAVGNLCNDTLGLHCCDGTACPPSGICPCNSQQPCCMNLEGGWCNSTNISIELSCCNSSNLTCYIPAGQTNGTCIQNTTGGWTCPDSSIQYRAMDGSWKCCSPPNSTKMTEYQANPYPDYRQLCCEPGYSLGYRDIRDPSTAICCPAGSVTSDGTCCNNVTENMACNTGYLYSECCKNPTPNCTTSTPYDICCNANTTKAVCNDPSLGEVCCNDTCVNGAGMGPAYSVCCHAPNNTAVCSGPTCCSAACVMSGGTSVCCPGVNVTDPGSSTQWVCAGDKECCNHTCSDKIGTPAMSSFMCCPNATDQVCSNNQCCDSALLKSCVDENGGTVGSTACCPIGVVSCNGICCNATQSCSSEYGTKQCCGPGTNLWDGVCCPVPAQKTFGSQHICCDEMTHVYDAATGTCCWKDEATRFANEGNASDPVWFNNAVSPGPGVPPACPVAMCCPLNGTVEVCDATNSNNTQVCCPHLCTGALTGVCPPYRYCCLAAQPYCNSVNTPKPDCCSNCLVGTDNQQYCCPAGVTKACVDAASGNVDCCDPAQGKTPVPKNSEDMLLSANHPICCPANNIVTGLPNVAYCTGTGNNTSGCCDHPCTYADSDVSRTNGFCCPAGATVCNVSVTSGENKMGCCAPPNAGAPIDGNASNKMCCTPGKQTAYCSLNGTSDGCCGNDCTTMTKNGTVYNACCPPGSSLTCGATTVTTCDTGSMKCCVSPKVAVNVAPAGTLGTPAGMNVAAPKECCDSGDSIAVAADGTYQCCGTGTGKVIVNDSYQTSTSYNCCTPGAGGTALSCNMQCCNADTQKCAGGQCCATNMTAYKSGTPWVCCTTGQIPMNRSSSPFCCSLPGYVCARQGSPDVQNCCTYGQGCDILTGTCAGSPPPNTCPSGFEGTYPNCVYHCPTGSDYYYP